MGTGFEGSAAAAVRVLGNEIRIALDPSSATALNVEGVGTIDIYATEDDARVLLRAVVQRSGVDAETLATAMRLNAAPFELGGAALGHDSDDGLVLIRLVDVQGLSHQGFRLAFDAFVAALTALPAKIAGEGHRSAAPNSHDGKWLLA